MFLQHNHLILDPNCPLTLKFMSIPLFDRQKRNQLLVEVADQIHQLPQPLEEDEKIITTVMFLSICDIQKRRIAHKPEITNRFFEKFPWVEKELKDFLEFQDEKIPWSDIEYYIAIYRDRTFNNFESEYQLALSSIRLAYNDFNGSSLYKLPERLLSWVLLIGGSYTDLVLKQYIRGVKTATDAINAFITLFKLAKERRSITWPADSRVERHNIIYPWAISLLPLNELHKLIEYYPNSPLYIFHPQCPSWVFVHIMHQCLVNEAYLFEEQSANRWFASHEYILLHQKRLPQVKHTIPLEYIEKFNLRKSKGFVKTYRILNFITLFELPEKTRGEIKEIITKKRDRALAKALESPTEYNRWVAGNFVELSERVERAGW